MTKYPLDPGTGLPILENPKHFWSIQKTTDDLYWVNSNRYQKLSHISSDFPIYSIGIYEKEIIPAKEEVGHWEYGQWAWSQDTYVIDSEAVPEEIVTRTITGLYTVKYFNTKKQFLKNFTEEEWEKEVKAQQHWLGNLEAWLDIPVHQLYQVLPLNSETILNTAEKVLNRFYEKDEEERVRKEKENEIKARESQFLGDYPPKGLNSVTLKQE